MKNVDWLNDLKLKASYGESGNDDIGLFYQYVDYYYGVRANEMTADRAYYQGESAVNIEVGARGGYMFKQKHFVFLLL